MDSKLTRVITSYTKWNWSSIESGKLSKSKYHRQSNKTTSISGQRYKLKWTSSTNNKKNDQSCTYQCYIFYIIYFVLRWSTVFLTVYLLSGENLFAKTDLSDETVGILLLVISLVLIMTSLIFMVKLLNSLLKGSVAKLTKKIINADFPGKLSFLTGYVAILVGTGWLIITFEV